MTKPVEQSEQYPAFNFQQIQLCCIIPGVNYVLGLMVLAIAVMRVAGFHFQLEQAKLSAEPAKPLKTVKKHQTPEKQPEALPQSAATGEKEAKRRTAEKHRSADSTPQMNSPAPAAERETKQRAASGDPSNIADREVQFKQKFPAWHQALQALNNQAPLELLPEEVVAEEDRHFYDMVVEFRNKINRELHQELEELDKLTKQQDVNFSDLMRINEEIEKQSPTCSGENLEDIDHLPEVEPSPELLRSQVESESVYSQISNQVTLCQEKLQNLLDHLSRLDKAKEDLEKAMCNREAALAKNDFQHEQRLIDIKKLLMHLMHKPLGPGEIHQEIDEQVKQASAQTHGAPHDSPAPTAPQSRGVEEPPHVNAATSPKDKRTALHHPTSTVEAASADNGFGLGLPQEPSAPSAPKLPKYEEDELVEPVQSTTAKVDSQREKIPLEGLPFSNVELIGRVIIWMALPIVGSYALHKYDTAMKN